MLLNGRRIFSLALTVGLVPASCGDRDPMSPTTTSSPDTNTTEPTGAPGTSMVPTDTSADTSLSSGGGDADPSTTAPVTSTDPGETSSGSSTGPQGDPSVQVIDFDDLSHADKVTDQYDHAVFSSVDDCNALVIKFADIYGTSAPNMIHVNNNINYACHGKAPLTIDFPTPAYDLSFMVSAVEEIGVTSHVQVFQLGVETAVVDIVGVGDVYAPMLIDLSGYPGVTRIVIAEEPTGDNFGHFYDDFTFTVFE